MNCLNAIFFLWDERLGAAGLALFSLIPLLLILHAESYSIALAASVVALTIALFLFRLQMVATDSKTSMLHLR